MSNMLNTLFLNSVHDEVRNRVTLGVSSQDDGATFSRFSDSLRQTFLAEADVLFVCRGDSVLE